MRPRRRRALNARTIGTARARANGLVPSYVSGAAWELERADARLPRPRIRRRPRMCVVLVHVPERAAILRVNTHRGVVAPAGVRRRLHAGAVLQYRLRLRELTERITVPPPCIANARENARRVHDAIAEGKVPLLVERDASHPPVDAVVRRPRSLLMEHWVARVAQLPPSNTRDAELRFDRLVGHERLMRTEVAVLQPPQRPLPRRQDVEELVGVRDARLREAVTRRRRAREDCVVRGDRHRLDEPECGSGWIAPADVRLEHVQPVERRMIGRTVVHRTDEVLGASGRWQPRTGELRRQDAVAHLVRRLVQVEANELRVGIARDELLPVDPVDTKDLVASGRAVLELTRGDKEPVRHQA